MRQQIDSIDTQVKQGLAIQEKLLQELRQQRSVAELMPDLKRMMGHNEELEQLPLFGISKKIYKGEVFPPESDDFVSDDNLFNYQAKVIKEVAAEESCVIIGRCADFILKDNPNVIRLFFYAPREDCITRVKTQNGGKEKDIIRKIEKTDKYRSDYYKYHTGKDWNDSRNYDFCLNTASMSYEKLVAVVKAYIQQYA